MGAGVFGLRVRDSAVGKGSESGSGAESDRRASAAILLFLVTGGEEDRVMLHSAVGSMLQLRSFQLFRCWFSSFDPQGCFSTRCNSTLGVQACNFGTSPLQA